MKLISARSGNHNTVSINLPYYRQRLVLSDYVLRYLFDNPNYFLEANKCASISEFADRVKEYFFRRAIRDGLCMLQNMPDRNDSVMEIGGGIGASLALFIQNMRSVDRIIFVEQETRTIRGNQWCMRKLAQQFLERNGIPRDRYIFLPASKHEIHNIMSASISMVVSFRALGYQFPVDFYASEISRLLKSSGVLILDISKARQNSSGEFRKNMFTIEKMFQNVSIIEETHARLRLKACNPVATL